MSFIGYNITQKTPLVKGLVIHTMLTLAPLQHTKGLLGWCREQAGQASAIVALYQQGLVAALVARFKCSLKRHKLNITHKRVLVKG